MLYDDILHGAWAGRRAHVANGRSRTIPPTQTRPCVRTSLREPVHPLVPESVAAAVLEEASAWLGQQLPPEWISELSRHAQEVCAHNPRFRKSIQRKGNAGRDHLWAFTRHWLAALLLKHQPDLHAKLPTRYNVGSSLPK